MKLKTLIVCLVVPFGFFILGVACLLRLRRHLWRASYLRNLISLALARRIDGATVIHALRNWPAAVCGSHGAYVLDDTFRM